MMFKAWHFWKHMPFVVRVLITASAALIVAGMALLISVAQEDTEQVKARLDRTLADQLAILPSTLSEWIVVGDFAVIKQSLDTFVNQKGVTSITYRSTKGAIVTSQDEPVELEAPDWFAAGFGNPHRSGLVGVKVGGRDYGAIEVVISAHLAINQAWARLQRHIAILALAVGLDFLGILFVVRNGLRPLTALDEGARALEEGNLAARIPLQGSPELMRTIRAFNRMAESVEISQNKLQQTLDRLAMAASVFEHATEGITITDAELRILDVNPAFSRITGYSRTEAVGKRAPRMLSSGRHDTTFYAAAWQAIQDEGQWRGEVWNQHKNGEAYPEQLSIAAVRDVAGNVTHYIGIFTDISELARQVAERTQELNEAKAQAEAASRAKSDFLANMSHEIRTPMNAILGLARMGAKESVRGTTSQALFKRIQDSGSYLLRIINDILDLSKIEAGKLAIDPQPFRLCDVVAGVRNHISDLAEQKGLGLCVDVAVSLPIFLVGDPQRLQQILTNLLSNAVKFTEQGQVALNIARTGEKMIFRVTDTGIGMTAEQLGRLFTPFEQGDTSITRNYGGTGLGLAISRRLAQLMGGDITASSELGAGSTFTLTLPMAESSTTVDDHLAVADQIPSIPGCRILAAEDIEVNRLVLEDMLVDAGARVVFAENGKIAVDLVAAQANAFDVVLMDVMMPVMDGYEATRRIRAIAPHLPIIGLTAYALAEEREKCLSAGMINHVTKPIDPNGLIQSIRQAAPAASAACGASTAPMQTHTTKTSETGRANSSDMDVGESAKTGLIDWPYLQQWVGAKPGRLAKFVQAALHDQRDKPDRLRTASAALDAGEIQKVAHGLRSVAGNLRAQHLMEEATEVEKAAREDQPRACALAEHLAATTDQFLAELTNWLKVNDADRNQARELTPLEAT